MKVIDLLNKIANGEKIPKKVEYKGSVLYYNCELNDYCCDYEDSEGELHGEYLFISSFDSIANYLNDEVEIIEDNEIEQIEMKYYQDEPANICDLAHKVYELIDEVNKLKENK